MNKTTNSIKLLRSVMLLLDTMLTLSAQTARAEVSLVASPAAGGNINFDPNNSNYVIVTPNYGYIVDRVEMSFEYNSQPYTNELAQVGEKYRIDMPMGVTDVTVTAYFRLDTNFSFTITFESNGGDGGSMDAVTQTSLSYTIPTCEYTKSNNMFIGWATSADGNVEYQPGDCITLTSNLTLFAKWVALSGTTSNDLNWSVAKSGTDFYELTISGNGPLKSNDEFNYYKTLLKSTSNWVFSKSKSLHSNITFLANFNAPSTASAPLLVKKTLSIPDTSLIFFAASTAGTL